MKLNRIRKSFGSLCVLDGVSADLEEGGVTAVLGPSGCGKTTLLRICAGLIEPDDPPDSALKELRARRSGFLFQEPRLLPWETAQANVELVLHDRPANVRREIAGKLLEDVGLGAYSGYYPSELSGGMRQRVAMARSFAYGSETLYLDEPFQGLDLELKLSLFDAFRALISAAGSGPTVVFVTHDVTEACLLGNRIYVLSHRPAVVRHRLENPVGPSDRSLHNPAVRDVEGALYDVILSASGHG